MEPEIYIIEGFLDKNQADWAWSYFLNNTDWHQDVYNFGGREVPAPRYTAYYGEGDYTYSGQRKSALPVNKPIARLLDKIESETEDRFNSILLNLYRDGRDSISFHADDEPELGKNPLVSSLSLGSTRYLDFKHNASGKIVSVPLRHGDYLVMGRTVQSEWKHGIKKSKTPDGRISLTFRQV